MIVVIAVASLFILVLCLMEWVLSLADLHERIDETFFGGDN